MKKTGAYVKKNVMKAGLRIGIVILLVLSIILGGALLVFDSNRESYDVEISLPEVSQDIQVYIDGQVQHPGVYVLPQNSRMQQLIDAAGGLNRDADPDALNPVSLLRDGDQVYIPSIKDSRQKININTAEAWLLDALPGIGETLAGRIVAFREESGPFSSVDDLMNVEGVRLSAIDNIRDKITVR